MLCKICGSESKKLFTTKVLNKYNVQYYKCPQCEFIQTEEEYWLGEAYKSSMNLSDTGVVTRNILLAIKTSLVLNFLFDKKSDYLDYAGGWGILTRLMRDIGFNFYWYDPYTENQIARGFEGNLDKKYAAITVFEGFEHFQAPYEDIEKMFSITDTIILSTSLTPKPTPKPKDWWYYSPEHGQHIALYSESTFKVIARKYLSNYYTDGKYFHILSKKKLNSTVVKFLLSPIGYLLFPIVLLTNKSKTSSDNRQIAHKK